MTTTSTSDLCCPTCGQTFWLTGDHPCQRAAALAAWRGCCVEPARIVRIQTPREPMVGGLPAPAAPSSGAAGSGAPTGADTPAPSSNGSAPDVCPVAVRSGEAGGGWRHTVQAVALYVGVPCVWLGFLAALAARMT